MMQTETDSGKDQHARYLTLAVWLGTALLLLLIPLKILSMGYLPPDDVLRHTAKAVSGKTWPEIMLIREGFGGDEHPGWHAMLGLFHRLFGWDTDGLIYFSLLVPCVVFWFALLLGRKRPEALLGALLAAAVTAPDTLMRPLIGRPFVFMMIVYVIVLQWWVRREKISPGMAALTTALFAVSVWVHGAWYLFGIVPAGFALAGQWRKSLVVAGCWLAGTFFGATFTGHPFAYLRETTAHLFGVFGGQSQPQALVFELQPGSGDVAFLLVLGLVLVWRVARGEWKPGVVRHPLVIIAALGWVLGLQISRFWLDWGFPAALVWLAQELEEALTSGIPAGTFPSILLAGFAALGIFITATRDTNNRWTANLATEYVTPDTPGIDGWLPDSGGLVYDSQMSVFFRFFYKNPHAPWRYVLGFEPGIMPEDDFATLRNIQKDASPEAYVPWVKKMQPADRMILLANSQPDIPGLEWHHAVADTWIGRLPRTNAPASTKP